MRNEKNRRAAPDLWSMGTIIGMGAAVGTALGALLQNVTLYLCAGAAIGVVVGAIVQTNKGKVDKR